MKKEELGFQYEAGHHDNGQKSYESYSYDCIDYSLIIWYHENGQKSQVECVSDDYERHGPSTSWYPSGQKESELNYKDGNLNGKAIYWYESGIKQIQKNYKNNELDSLYEEWYESGQIMFEIHYKNGQVIKFYEWDKYGTPVSGLPGMYDLKMSNNTYNINNMSIEKSDNGLFNGYTSAELDLISEKADKGDIEAQYLLGKALCPDLDQTMNSPEGNCNNKYIEMSAEGGHGPAQYLMGMVHIDSEIESELTESEMWFKKASDQGFSFATLALYKVQCAKLNIEWVDKYAETDSSIANYEEVNKFSLKVKVLLEAVESNYEENKRIDDNATNNDEFFAHMSEILMDFLGDLYPRTLVYLENIENDNKIREQINKAISMALLIADEDVFDTTKRVLNIVESMNESALDREARISIKH
jgi:TPR repeat protein